MDDSRKGESRDRCPRQPLERVVSTVAQVAGLVLAALLAQSFFWPPAIPAALKVVVAAVGPLAAFRPMPTLLVLAGILPFGRVLSTLVSPSEPVGITEALALAYLAGWSWNRLRGRVEGGPRQPGLVLAYLFAAVALASVLVEIGIYRYWREYWQPFLGQLLIYLARDYLSVGVESRPWAESFGGLPSLATAATLLEGLAIGRVAQELCVREPAFGRRLLWALGIAAVGTAILSLGMASYIAALGGRSLTAVLGSDRIAVHVTKVNTAGSWFVLFVPIVVGLGIASTVTRPRLRAMMLFRWSAVAAGSGLLLTALWMTGTRTAMTAGIVVSVLTALYVIASRGRSGRRGWKTVTAMVAASVMVVVVLGVGFYQRTSALEAASSTRGSLPVRLLMWKAAFTTLIVTPFFGAGIGQFPYRVAEFDPDATLAANVGLSRFNAHNQFLEVAAELGVIGGLLFVGMFAAILWRAWKAFRTSRDPALGGAIAGVVAFLITCLAGQPLLYNVVAFPFWMVLGVLLAAGDMPAEAVESRLTPARRLLWSRVIAGFMVFLALSIPVRVWQGKERVNFALARYGFSGLREASDGRKYRLVRDDGTFFTYPHARWLVLPIQRDVEAGRNRLEVDVSLDGRRARTLTLADDAWQTVEFMIPADAKRRFRRVDLTVRAPAGVAAQVRVGAAEIKEDETVEKRRAR